MKRILAILLAIVLVVGLAACGVTDPPADSTPDTPPPPATNDRNDENGVDGGLEHVNLVLAAVEFASSNRTGPILEAINEILLREINATLEIRPVSQDAYDIILTGIEGVDIITSADFLNYFSNARAGAFMPIDMDDVRNLMPTWYEDNVHQISAALVDGELFAIFGSEPPPNLPGFILRKDLMEKYGITEVTTMDDLREYFAAIRDNEPTMLPLALDTGVTSWMIGAMAFGATGLKAPGGPNCTFPVVLDKFDYPNFVLRMTYEQEVLIDFFEIIREFRLEGFWNEDVFANPTPMNEAFMAGRSGAAWITSIRALNNIYRDMLSRLPEAELYLFDFGIGNNIPIDHYSPMGDALSLPRTANHYERALMFMELLYTNKELALLFNYGIEGEDWVVDGNGEITLLQPENRLGFPAPIALANRTIHTIPPVGGNHPEFERIMAEIDERTQLNPFVGFGFDATPVAAIDAVLWDIHMEFVVPIYLGFVDDVPAAFAAAQERLEAVGIRRFQEEVYNQLLAYIAENNLPYTLTMG